MDVKAALIESITWLQRGAPEGSELWNEYAGLLEQVKTERDPKVLHGMALALRELIVAARAEATDFSKWPDESPPPNNPQKG